MLFRFLVDVKIYITKNFIMSAISALKGYRTQFLYSLYRILSDYDIDIILKSGSIKFF